MTVTAQQTLDDSQRKPFRPEMHTTTVGNATYLEVKWRLVWFRQDHPNGIIETELVEHKVSAQHPDMSYAVCKATVQTADGAGAGATGYGSESRGDFKDYLEKAETRALGRALAALGYGTQFTADFETGGRMVDNPAPRQAARSQPATNGNGSNGGNGYGAQDNGELATPKQIAFCRSLIKDAGLTANWLAMTLADEFNAHGLAELTKREISQLIDGLKAGRFGPTPSEQADDGLPAEAINPEAGGPPSDPFGELPW